MENLKQTLASGAEIEVQVSSFEKSHRLLQAVKKSGLSMEKDVVDLLICPDVQPILWDCMAVCLYNGVRITKETFEAPEKRGDYLLVAQTVMMQNLSPFFSSLGSKS